MTVVCSKLALATNVSAIGHNITFISILVLCNRCETEKLKYYINESKY